MKKPLIGITLGAIAGILDVIPMILQKLTWDANISAFVLWVISGYLIAVSNINIKPVCQARNLENVAVIIMNPKE